LRAPDARHAGRWASETVRNEEGKMSSAKNEVESLLRKLPDDCTLEDIQYHLHVLEKIQRRLEVADT
jgi:hypothetical protein